MRLHTSDCYETLHKIAQDPWPIFCKVSHQLADFIRNGRRLHWLRSHCTYTSTITQTLFRQNNIAFFVFFIGGLSGGQKRCIFGVFQFALTLQIELEALLLLFSSSPLFHYWARFQQALFQFLALFQLAFQLESRGGKRSFRRGETNFLNGFSLRLRYPVSIKFCGFYAT